jgi:type III secretion protein J
VRRLAPLLLLLMLAACGREQLYSKLSETQANEMVAILRKAGLEATKSRNGEEGWAVSAPAGDFPRAIEVLHAAGYPRDEFASLGTVFKKEGFVSSPTEERARLIFGLNQELSNTISQIDGVVQARVQVAMPEPDPLNNQPRPASASVFVKYQPGSEVERQVGQVKALVVNAVEGLRYENVTVAMFPARPLPSVPPPTLAHQAWSTAQDLVVPLVAIALMIFAWPVGRRWWLQRRALRARESVVDGRG